MAAGPPSTTPDRDPTNESTWRKHFPVDTDADDRHTRRIFVGGLAVAGGAVACGRLALEAVSPESTTDAENPVTEEFEPLTLEKKFPDLAVGETIQFHYPDHKSPCLLLRTTKQDFVAWTQKCTHLACPVIPDLNTEQLACPCHKGAFDLHTGSPVAGPPRKPLQKVVVEVAEDGTLTAIGLATA